MKKLIVSIVMVIVMSSPLMAYPTAVGVWNFDDGSMNDTSGIGIAANGSGLGGAAVVADPLGQRGNVLYIPKGGKMTTPSAAEPKFDSLNWGEVSMWVYAPVANDWWSFTAGKGGNGAPRFFVDTGGDGRNYFFDYATLTKTGGGLLDLSLGAWGGNWDPASGWHHIRSRVYKGTPEQGFVHEIWCDGVLHGSETTAQYLEDVDGIFLTDALFEIAPNANWTGYVDDVVYIPEPCTIALLGLGALALRRKK